VQRNLRSLCTWTQVRQLLQRELCAGSSLFVPWSQITSPACVAEQAAQIRDRKARIDKLRNAVRAAMEAASPAAKEVAKSAIWSDAVSDDEVCRCFLPGCEGTGLGLGYKAKLRKVSGLRQGAAVSVDKAAAGMCV